MKKFIFLCIVLAAFNCYSQIEFEHGYFIDNKGQSITCLIKNVDWLKNPTEFKYKLSENGEVQIATIEEVQEFGVDSESKYIRAVVDLDTSRNEIGKLSRVRAPSFSNQKLFLKLLVNGKARLFLYENNYGRKYFYQKGLAEIKPLIYKQFIKGVNKIGENNRYKQQLWADLNYNGLVQKKLSRVSYEENDLIEFFNAYNGANGQIIDIKKNEKRDLFNFSIRPGVSSSKMDYILSRDFLNRSHKVSFDRELSFRFGVEMEVVMPFNKNKWALLAEPFYNSYKSELNTPRINRIDYKFIGFGFGLRHYIFLGKKSKLFVNGSIVLSFNLDDSADIIALGRQIDVNKSATAAFGIGYTFNNRVSVEFRHNFNGGTKEYVYSRAEYSGQSLILGYKLF